MHIRPHNTESGLTPVLKRGIAKIAFERMTREVEIEFESLRQFQTHSTNRFLAWIDTVDRRDRLEASLSKTARHLLFHRINCRQPLNFDRWVNSYLSFPLHAGLNPGWRPRRHSRKLFTLLKDVLAPVRIVGPHLLEISDDSPLAISGVRALVDSGSRIGDVVLSQFVLGDLSAFDLSFVSLLGIGQTAWRISSSEEVEGTVKRLLECIATAREVMSSGRRAQGRT